MATLLLVALTLLGALPVYWYVARKSPRGEGSIAMMEHLLPWWQGKLLVLVLLGFVATDFTITITLSAADATAHFLENPFCPSALRGEQLTVTLALVGALGAVFLRGFKEAIGVAVVLVAAYLALNAVVVGFGLYEVASRPHVVAEWRENLWAAHGSPADYAADEADQRGDFNLVPGEPVLFLEVHVRDASDFSDVLHVRGVEVGPHRVLRAEATAVPNGVAALLFHLRDITQKRPSVYFNWGEGNPLLHIIRYLFSGHGDVPPLTREIIRRAESDAARRPAVYVGV
jgi:hypothetical protein